ncbi:MAG: CobD/CbiB family protein [Burkholderiales bacterium]
MSFLSLVAALLLEQLRPLRHNNGIYLAFARYADNLERQFNAGHYRHGVIAWLLAVLPVVAAVLAVQALCYRLSPLLALAWNVVVLYLTMGFRRFSHYFTEIMRVLRDDDLPAARDYLGKWRGAPADEFNANEVARVAIEQGLIGSHKHVFGPIAAFIVLGPAGAILYRLAALLNDSWGGRDDPEFGEFGRFAERFFYWLDWLPVRLTAVAFAVVGNFEDAVYCWRTQAQSWATRAEGILLAAGAGALGVRLGEELHQYGSIELRPEIGVGEPADVVAMHGAVGLIWRALVLWVFLVLLVTVARAVG